MRGTVVSALVVIISGCDRRCPVGTELQGTVPPAGFEQWCQRQAESGDVVRHGRTIKWHPNGKKAEEVVYENGLRTGNGRAWYPSGVLQLDQTFKDDVLVASKDFDINGKPVSETATVQGRTSLTRWYPTGEKQVEGLLDDATTVGHLIVWHKNGTKKRESDLYGSDLDGEYRSWFANGAQQKQGQMRNGDQLGEWKLFYADGSPKAVTVIPAFPEDKRPSLTKTYEVKATWPDGARRAEFQCLQSVALAALRGTRSTILKDKCRTWVETEGLSPGVRYLINKRRTGASTQTST